MKRAVPLMLCTLMLALAPTAGGGLPQDIERVVRSTDLGGARIGISVRDAVTGRSLADLDAESPMIPASNMKLLTTGAALHTLGSEFRFTTRLLFDGDRLVVIGDGDPAFGDPELLEHMGQGGLPLDIESFIDLWVQPVVESGIRSLAAVVVDDRIFDRDFVHERWPRDQLNRRYCAEVAGLSFHANTLHFFPRPQAGSRPSLTEIVPRVPWIIVRNRATSDVSPNAKDTAWIARRFDTNELTVYGNVRHAYRTPVPVTVHDPPELFARILANRLEASGVHVAEVRVADLDEDQGTGTLIGPPVVTPISTVVTRCNRDSQNLYAESLLKRMGHARTGQPGSWLNGAAIVRHVLHDRIDADLATSVIISDGSGLSRDNRVAPAAMTQWLHSLHTDQELGAVFVSSLAVAGETGTLRKRMRTVDLQGAIVEAKSGYINGVSCLSGFVTVPGAGRRCFSIMINDLQEPLAKAKQMQDEIVAVVAEDLALQAAQLGSAAE